MTSSYSEKITKLKNALENVFVKKTDIQNNLTSTDTNKPLSANQGKILDTNKVDKISGKSLSTNDFTNTYKTKLDNLDTLLESKASNTHTHGNLQNDGSVGTSNNINKNVITDGNGKITTEDKPTIPIASTGNTYADEGNGSYGSSTNYARADHKHPKSSLYAEATHNHDDRYYTETEIDTALNDKVEESDLLDLIYPIGSIYMEKDTTSHSVCPIQTRLGGTWTRIENRFLYASEGGQGIGHTDGYETITLTAAQSGVPAHSHGMAHTHNHQHTAIGYVNTGGGGTARRIPIGYDNTSAAGTLATSADRTASSKSDTDNNTGADASEAHDNMPPYIIVNVWERTA